MLSVGLGLNSAALVSNGAKFPLDEFAPNLFAVFSFQLLTSRGTSPCIRVRRSSDNALKDIGYAGKWLDLNGPDGLLNFVGAGSGFVVTWYDQSGLGRHITQNTAASQRRIVNAGSLESFGGRPALFGSAVGQLYTSTWPVLPQPATFISTLKLPDYTVGQDQNLLRTNALSTGLNAVPYISHSLGGKVAMYSGAVLSGATLVDGTSYALSWTMSGASSVVGTNGSYVTGDSGTESVNSSPNIFTGLNGAAPIVGQCGDLLVFNSALTQAQMSAISKAIGTPRGIVIP